MTAGAEAGVDVTAELALHLGNVAAELAADRQHRRRIAASLWWVQPTAMSLAALPVVRSADGGPNGGYFWAVQRITVGPFGAGTDAVTLYKGSSVTSVAPQNALNTLVNATAGAFTPWHPGGKGLILMPDESLIVAGTITGTSPTLNMDVIQGTLDVLPDFLR